MGYAIMYVVFALYFESGAINESLQDFGKRRFIKL